MTPIQQAIKALRIYDDCMAELSFFVGHCRPLIGEVAGDRAEEVCREAMKAQRILHKLDPKRWRKPE